MVDPDVKESSKPDDTVELNPKLDVGMALATPDVYGGRSPDARLENAVAVLSEVVEFTTPPAERPDKIKLAGGTTPDAPVEFMIIVPPLTVL
jgi:hypothetical protein